MSSAFTPATVPTSDWRWSPAEKVVARRAFDLALRRDLENVVREAKERAGRVTQASELWELEEWLGKQRRGLDGMYDYRYSKLPLVFASLIRKERLSERDLAGLAEEKLDAIRVILPRLAQAETCGYWKTPDSLRE